MLHTQLIQLIVVSLKQIFQIIYYLTDENYKYRLRKKHRLKHIYDKNPTPENEHKCTIYKANMSLCVCFCPRISYQWLISNGIFGISRF